MGKEKNRGTLTLEAALVMPVFVMVFFSIMSLVRFVYTQESVQYAVTQASRSMAELSYLGYKTGLFTWINDEEAGIEKETANIDEYLKYFTSFFDLAENDDSLHSFLTSIMKQTGEIPEKAVMSAAARYFIEYYLNGINMAVLGIKGGVAGIDLEESRFYQDDEDTIEIIVKYVMDIPLLRVMTGGFQIVQRAAARPWLGGEGSRVSGQNGANDDIWSLGNLERGRRLREIFGANLPVSYPVISDFRDGTVKMIKSIDLTASYYKLPFNVEDKLSGYIDDLASFNGNSAPWGSKQIIIDENEITSRELLLIIPQNNIAPEITQTVGKMAASAANSGIILKIEKYGIKK